MLCFVYLHVQCHHRRCSVRYSQLACYLLASPSFPQKPCRFENFMSTNLNICIIFNLLSSPAETKKVPVEFAHFWEPQLHRGEAPLSAQGHHRYEQLPRRGKPRKKLIISGIREYDAAHTVIHAFTGVGICYVWCVGWQEDVQHPWWPTSTPSGIPQQHDGACWWKLLTVLMTI